MAVPTNGLDMRGEREKKTKDVSQVSGLTIGEFVL